MQLPFLTKVYLFVPGKCEHVKFIDYGVLDTIIDEINQWLQIADSPRNSNIYIIADIQVS